MNAILMNTIFVIVSFDKCFFLDRFPCFFEGNKFIEDTINFLF